MASEPPKKAEVLPALAHQPLSLDQLEAENRRLKRALEVRDLQKRTKLLAKKKQLLKELQVQRALEAAVTEHTELKQVAEAVRRNMHICFC